MEKKDIIKVLKLISLCPIKGWQDLDEDTSQKDIWDAQADWIKNKLDNDYFDSI